MFLKNIGNPSSKPPPVSFLSISDAYPWQTLKKDGWKIASAGSKTAVEKIFTLVKSVRSLTIETLIPGLAKVQGHFGFLGENRNVVIAITDRIRGYPLFYTRLDTNIRFSNSARALLEDAHLNELDHISLLELLMAGYVTGPNTVYRGIAQVQAGELVVFNKMSGKVSSGRYFELLPQGTEYSQAELLERLAAATDQSFRRLAMEANGRVILIPLSGGLDSRLVITMLKSIGAKEVQAFSYGPAGNQEASRAKYVAERLGVPWKFYPSERAAAHRLFWQPACKDYWRRADGLCSVPNMQEYQVIAELERKGKIPKDAIIVNGQSGDFITGGHIPFGFGTDRGDSRELFNAVVAKHFSLWKMLKTRANLEAIRLRFEENLAELRSLDYLRQHHFYEYWEWQERQAKFVVNQQRTYDFFRLEWMLPLWDREYCDFWRDVPLELKLGQALYREYLQTWDYAGLFTDPKLDKPIIRWPGKSKAVIPLARVAGLVGGPRAKEFVYSRLKYFGHYSNQLGCYRFGHFLSRANQIRNSVSLFSETWVREEFPKWIAEHFSLEGR